MLGVKRERHLVLESFTWHRTVAALLKRLQAGIVRA